MRRLIVLLVFFAAVVALAQQHPNLERGVPADKLFAGDGPDAVNLFNGNLLIAIPIGQRYPVNANFSYGITLVYQGRPWEAQRRCDGTCYTQMVPTPASNAGLGWRVSFGDLIPPTSPRNTSGLWVYESADGAQHVLYPTLRVADPAYAGVLYTRDGTYLRLKDVGVDGNGNTLRDLEFPDGTIHRFTDTTLTQIRDRFGNYVNFSWIASAYCPGGGGYCGGGATLTIQDQHGRTHTVETKWGGSPATNSYLYRIDLAGFNGTRSIYNFGKALATIPRGCGDDDPLTSTDIAVDLLSSITLPDGSTYAMPSYSANGADCSTGLIQQLRLPTLGSVEWDYQLWSFTNPGNDPSRPYLYSVPGLWHRRLRDAAGNLHAQWTYDTSLVPVSSCAPYTCLPRELINTITTPQGDKSRQYFSVMVQTDTGPNTEGWSYLDYGLPFTRNAARQTSFNRLLSTETLNSGGTTVRTSFVRYERERAGTETERSQYDTNRRVVTQRTLFNDDGGRYADVDFSSFDGLGHYRTATTNGNFDAGNVRETFTNYNPAAGTCTLDSNGDCTGFTMLSPSAPWVLGTYTATRVTEGATAVHAEYCFDSASGFLLLQRQLAGTSQGIRDLVTRRNRDSGGNLWMELRFGGDNQSINSGDLCTLTLPSSVYQINHSYQYGVRRQSEYDTGVKTLDIDVDANTGLPSVSRDVAGLATTYQYDGLGRLRWTIPSTGHGGRTENLYTIATSSTAPATLDIKRWNNAGTVVLGQEQQVFDSFGRLWKERRLMPAGWSTREHGYNASGWRTFTSEFAYSDTPPNRTTSAGFDPFGRPGTVTAPDGKVTTLAYSGVRETRRTVNIRTGGDASTQIETPTTTTSVYDRQGRLYQVREYSRPDGLEATTQYAYHPTGNISSVTGSGQEATQTRLFNYDGRGFLVSERLPERGSSGNAETSYYYDGGGHRTRRYNGLYNLWFEYDRAERPTFVKDHSLRVIKSFEYGTSNGTNDWRLGKLVKAVRNNYNDAWGTNTTITENYTYGGRDGRVSSRYTQTSENVSFSQTFTWNELGDLQQIGYPYCVTGCWFTPPSVTNQYTNGYLTGVTNWASSISYHATGLVNQVANANGVTWTQAADPWGMPRPASISTAGGGAAWSSGTYSYDGAGNVTVIGSDYYLYDRAERVKEGTAFAAGNKLQRYSYDTFGNVTNMQTVVNGSPSDRSLVTSATTNHLSSGTYDADGSLLTFANSTHEYDAVGMLRLARRSSGEEWWHIYTADDQRILSWKRSQGVRWWRLRDLGGKVLTEFTWSATSGWTSYKTYIYRRSTLLGPTHPISPRPAAGSASTTPAPPATSPTARATSSSHTSTTPSAKRPPTPSAETKSG